VGKDADDIKLCAPPQLPLVLKSGAHADLQARCVPNDANFLNPKKFKVRIFSNDPDEAVLVVAGACRVDPGLPVWP
jgi:hypothetical protein